MRHCCRIGAVAGLECIDQSRPPGTGPGATSLAHPAANKKLFYSPVVHFSSVIAFFSYFCRRPPFLKRTAPQGMLALWRGNSKPNLRRPTEKSLSPAGAGGGGGEASSTTRGRVWHTLCPGSNQPARQNTCSGPAGSYVLKFDNLQCHDSDIVIRMHD